MKRMIQFLALVLLCALAPLAHAQEAVSVLDVYPLSPIEMPACAPGQEIPLYCGPTQGAYRHEGRMLDTGKPFLYFGQADCWAMVASGTPEAIGPVGWVESALLTLPEQPALEFEDALSVMIEEDTFLTDTPLTAAPEPLFELPRGTQVILLAQYEGWGYVQYESPEIAVRAFLPLTSIE